jgi:ATP-dependent exoDNAse (exonuclease V) alpha subunit
MAESRTPNGRKQELRNGAIYEVAAFTKDGDLCAVHRDANGRVTSEVTIGSEFGNLTYGYCVTSHASQGKTVDRVFIAQSADSLRASSREQFYVSVSRGRESVVIYTDDKEALRDRVVESAARMSATEFEREREVPERMQQHVLWIQRIRQEAQDYARAQVAAMMRGIERLRPMMRRDRNGPERSL